MISKFLKKKHRRRVTVKPEEFLNKDCLMVLNFIKSYNDETNKNNNFQISTIKKHIKDLDDSKITHCLEVLKEEGFIDENLRKKNMPRFFKKSKRLLLE